MQKPLIQLSKDNLRGKSGNSVSNFNVFLLFLYRNLFHFYLELILQLNFLAPFYRYNYFYDRSNQ